MLLDIARFEFRYLLRNPLVWITAALGFVMVFFSMNLEGWEMGSEGGLLRNSAYATLRNSLMFTLMFMFVSASFVANTVIRDDQTGYGPIIRSTPITKFDYVIGRFLGAYAITAACMLVVPVGSLLGTMMPWANPANLGPNRISDHLYAYFLIALPNLLTHSAIFFALATITRSMMATYLAVISFVAAFFSLQEGLVRPQLDAAVAIAEPFAGRAVKDAVRYWTIAERNAMLPDFSGALLYNRLLWIGVSVLCLGVAYAVYRFAERGMSKRERKKLKLDAQASPPVQSSMLGYASGRLVGLPEALPTSAGACPERSRSGRAGRALMGLRVKFEFRQVILSPAFPVLLLFGMFNTFFMLTQRSPEYRPEYPTTLSLIPGIEEAFRLALMIVAVYYAGELVWRERDRRVHELIDAAPIPNWAYVVPKTMALALVLVSVLLCNVSAAIALQLSHGFTDIEPGKYLLWYVLPGSFDMLLLAAVAILVQSLSPHKAVGWGVMLLLMLWQELNRVSRFINHNLLNYGETPGMPLSDLNGAAFFWKGAWTVRLYWGALAVLLLLAAHLLWRRGTEIRLKPRLVLARRRLAGAPGIVGAAALLTFAATGAWAFYNTNILNEYRTKEESEIAAADFERRFGKYKGLPQPSLEEATLDIALDPQERRAVTRGRYLLRNLTTQPIADLHVSLPARNGLQLTSVAVAGARQIVNDTQNNYRILRLARPMQPNDALLLTFETRRWHRGFLSGSQDTTIVENGTLLTEEELIPVLGNYVGSIEDVETRRKYGLPELPGPPKLEDLSATSKVSFPNGWIKRFDITLSTVADQTPLAPGKKIYDVIRDGRRTARFVSAAPTRLRFSIQSARYAEKHRQHGAVDLAVYYHPRHHWNIDRMLDTMAASLDYYQANFGPYPHDHFRVVEFPAYHGHAEAFAGTIAFSESVGFIAEYNEKDPFDYVAGITAHEFAHQWWPGQMTGAEMEGYSVFIETLAQYSAHMVIKQMRGEEQVRRYLQHELDRYLGGRAWEDNEPPLARVLGGQAWISYRKGAMVMYLLSQRIGEDGVNRALRNMLARYRFKGAPYPRTVDLIAAFRAEAKTAEDQALITDLFERVTLYDLEVTQPTATRRPDGKWDVTLPIEARKFYVTGEGIESETPLDERIEIGLFTAEPGRLAFDESHVLRMERHPIRSGRQVLKFVSDKQPLYAGVDPYNFYIDRDAADNVSPVATP